MPSFTRTNGLKVNAVKIEHVELMTDGALLVPSDSSLQKIKVDTNFFIVHRPKSGGYYVEYENGAKAFLSSEMFETDYKADK